ncbi:MAG: hypothetical protein HY696_07500 [Deltaproteobacteria bacterium]|nr:hypothetical protein [Deltaproteobacteria bacterium]
MICRWETMMFTHRNTEDGAAALMALLGLLVLSGMGVTAVELASTSQEERAFFAHTEAALGLAQAGIEFAKNRIDQGVNPNVQNQPIAFGTFSTAVTPATNLLQAVGRVGTVQRSFAVTTPLAKDCFDLAVDQAQVAGPNLTGLKLYKNCLSKVTITHWRFSWQPDDGEHATELQVQGDPLFTVFEDFIGYPSGALIDATDLTLSKAPGVPTEVNKLEFDHPMTDGKTYSISVTLSDGSVVTRSFVDP